MGFQIPMKITGAMDSSTIITPGHIKPAFTSATIGQAGTVQQRANPVPTVQQRTNPVPTVQQRTNPAPTVQQRTNPAPTVQQRTNPIPSPALSIPPLPASSTLLRRGQKFTVANKDGSVPVNLKLKLDWQVMNPQCDLDASAFLLADNEKVPGEDWFVFYGQPTSPDNSIRYSGNTGKGAELLINLPKISPSVQKVTVAVTIYEAIQQHLHFGMVQNVSARIFNQMTNTELARIELTDCTNGVTALVVGELYRYKGAWKFNAVGSGVARDLAGFCAMYGIEAG